MISLLYIILAVLGLSFLIFVHELGHYFMARRVGMRVENICHRIWQATLFMGKRGHQVANRLVTLWWICQNRRLRIRRRQRPL